ncbi:MAG: 50S ribosomal protein L6 [bacterium ADurb.Bin212]|nr:MAG: 50S ribosomal protein L6 [bacterium ADurb.Bin212]
MSRVGNRPIIINDGVSIAQSGKDLKISSNKGEMSFILPADISIEQSADRLLVKRVTDTKEARSLHGLYARLIANAITGLSHGIIKNLDFKGTGYRAKVESNKLILNMGYSHEISLDIPESIAVNVNKNTISVSGYSSDIVGNFAAKVREVRKPEVYKGKGIKYSTETIKRKDGKAASGGKA